MAPNMSSTTTRHAYFQMLHSKALQKRVQEVQKEKEREVQWLVSPLFLPALSIRTVLIWPSPVPVFPFAVDKHLAFGTPMLSPCRRV